VAPTQPAMTASANQPAADHGSASANDSRATPTISHAHRWPLFSGRQPAGSLLQQDAMRSFIAYPAQQESCFTSMEKVCAASFSPSTIVRYGNN
jgi:hypothetical protein